MDFNAINCDIVLFRLQDLDLEALFLQGVVPSLLGGFSLLCGREGPFSLLFKSYMKSPRESFENLQYDVISMLKIPNYRLQL